MHCLLPHSELFRSVVRAELFAHAPRLCPSRPPTDARLAFKLQLHLAKLEFKAIQTQETNANFRLFFIPFSLLRRKLLGVAFSRPLCWATFTKWNCCLCSPLFSCCGSWNSPPSSPPIQALQLMLSRPRLRQKLSSVFAVLSAKVAISISKLAWPLVRCGNRDPQHHSTAMEPLR